ncbi:MAG: carbamoyltransferase [Nannocystaceae bacterium]|nr:hypothetical protein [bacterium]
MNPWSIGIADSHDACVCLLHEGRIASAIAVERLVRVKRAVVAEGVDPRRAKEIRAGVLRAITSCCKVAGITTSEVGRLCVASPDSRDESDIELNTEILGQVLPNATHVHMPHPEHHLAHAYSAFFMSGWSSAAALVVDAFGTPVKGQREEHTGLHFMDLTSKPHTVFKHYKPDDAVVPLPVTGGRWKASRDQLSGVGEIYRIVTILLGFFSQGTKFDDAGKTMGLAPYGTPLSEAPVLMKLGPDGTIDCSEAFEFLEAHNLVSVTPSGVELSVRGSSSPLSRFHKDLACQVQRELEGAVVHMARHLRRQTDAKRLVLAGGVFLNAVANRRIVRESGFDDVYVCPAATDDGTAIGAAYFAYQHASELARRRVTTRRQRCVGLGPSYSDEEVATALNGWPVTVETLRSVEDAAQDAGQRIAGGQVIGWFQGGSELGPRALGHRSILADPQDPNIKDVLNTRVKFREGFRPFAPAVLAERVSEVFEVSAGREFPFMLEVVPVREEYRARLPGITHVDGTARVQTVRAEDNPSYRTLIETYTALRGIPVVVNTSFNLKGMPIVESPLDALHCLAATELDAVVLGRHIVQLPDRGDWTPRADPNLKINAHGRLGYREMDLVVSLGGEVLDARTFALLRAMDGRRTLRELADRFEVSLVSMLRSVLGCMRKQWCGWTEVPAVRGGRRR